MIYYHSERIDNDVVSALTGRGFTVACYDESLTDREMYDLLLEADLVLIDLDFRGLQEGFVLGLASAFGKVVYAGPASREDWFTFEGFKPFQSLLEAAEAVIAEQEPNDDAQLDGDAAGQPGADPEHG